MITAKKIAQAIIGNKTSVVTQQPVKVYAPTNIALCKYWGKRQLELNLPETSSLSITLPNKGAHTTITVIDSPIDSVVLNGELLQNNNGFVQRLVAFLDLFRAPNLRFALEIDCNIPIAAGLASSACGFAAIVLALNKLFSWKLARKELSILARLGSGSASRSLWNGFVLWHRGKQADGMDSFAEPIATKWPELRIGLLLFDSQKKPISSRIAMQITRDTSPFYRVWPEQVKRDLAHLLSAIDQRNFKLLAHTAETNTLAMHATMQTASPVIVYSQPATLQAMQKIWQLRGDGLPLYFTQDAGPNLKLLFLQGDEKIIRQQFPSIEVITLF